MLQWKSVCKHKWELKMWRRWKKSSLNSIIKASKTVNSLGYNRTKIKNSLFQLDFLIFFYCFFFIVSERRLLCVFFFSLSFNAIRKARCASTHHFVQLKWEWNVFMVCITIYCIWLMECSSQIRILVALLVKHARAITHTHTKQRQQQQLCIHFTTQIRVFWLWLWQFTRSWPLRL